MKKIVVFLTATILLVACSGQPKAAPAAATQTPRVVVVTATPIVVPTAVPPTAQPAVVSSNDETECAPAHELGPWAPNNGLGEDFEVTANETVSSGVHIQLWWPAGSGQEWEKKEISTFLPPGLSVEVQDGAGRGWEYALSCSQDEINSQMAADHERRSTDTSYFGVVDIDDLIATGLVVVRFDRR